MSNNKWESVEICDVVDFYKGISVPRDETAIDFDVPYLHYGDVYKLFDVTVDLNKELKSIIKVSEDVKAKPQQYLKDGDIVYNLTSETVDDLGKAVHISNPDNLPFIAGMETTIMRIRDKRLLLPKFLNYLLMSKWFIKMLQQYVTGIKVFRAHPRDISKIKIPLPPLPTQHAIAEVLSSLDDKIELNREMNKTLEEMGRALFRHYFVDNPEARGWKMGKLGEVAEIITGKGSKSSIISDNGNIPVYGATGIIGYTNDSLFNCPKIITGRVGTHGIVNITENNFWATDNVLIITPYNAFYFVYFFVQQIDYVSLNRGSTQPLITQTDMRNLLLSIPPTTLLAKFEQEICPLMEQIAANATQTQTLTSLRDYLLPKLMSQKVKVVE